MGWIITGACYGQVSSTKNRFEVDVARGCAPLTVTATNLHSPTTDGIVWNPTWDGDESNIIVDSDAAPETFTFEYTEPGTYRLLHVIGNATDSGPIDTLIIEVLEPRIPQFNLINCTENRVLVDLSEENYYDQLEINYGDGTVQTVPTSRPSDVHPYASAGEYMVTVRGLLNVGDDSGCGDSTATINTFDGETFPEATLSLVEVVDPQSIRLEYELPNPDIMYQVRVSENGESSSRNYPLPQGSSEFELSEVEWNTRNNYYCLAVSAVDPCTGLTFPSNPLCTIALEAVADDLQNALSWQTEPELYAAYQVLRDEATLADTSATAYTDADVVCQETYAYQVSGSSGGGVSLSESISITTVSTAVPEPVTAVTSSLQELSIGLEWAEMLGAQQYYLYRSLGGDSTVLYDSLDATTATDLSYLDSNVEIDQEYCYQLSYLDACGNEAPLSEPTCLRIPSQAQLYFPNAFTPNDDGLNDVFLYKAALLESVTFEVFNRWGERLFSTDQRDIGWDGTYQGVMAPEGGYLYQIRVVDQLGNEFTQHGKFVLLSSTP
ncbi:MAG: gliding motility-associated C-terminal domain-containing protein [Cyclobacteriaceae bacterium]